MKLKHYEVRREEATAIIKQNWARFDRARWTLFQDGDGWDVGETVDKFRVFDWTDNPRRSGVRSMDHVEDWEGCLGSDIRLERVLRCLPEDKLITVILQEE